MMFNKGQRELLYHEMNSPWPLLPTKAYLLRAKMEPKWGNPIVF